MWRHVIPPVAIGVVLAAMLTGGDPIARLALRAGLPGVAARASDDPVLRGLALSGMGRQGEAAAAFALAGPAQDYNRATALALDEDYAGALLAYDALLARTPNHADARANFALLLSIYGGTELQLTFPGIERENRDGPAVAAFEARAGARAIGDGAESDGAATDIFAPEVKTGSGLRRVPKIFDDTVIKASEDWLTTMLDQPGKFLAARLLAEQKRRRAAGIGMPEEDGAW